MRALFALALPFLLLFLACEELPTPTALPVRELGTVDAIYPHLSRQGAWMLEYRMSRDTVYVDYETARIRVQDSAWKQALTHSTAVFYDDGQECMYTPSAQGCLEIRYTAEP